MPLLEVNGALEGQLANGTPVYNVALPLFKRRTPDAPPYRVLEVDPDASLSDEAQQAAYGGMERRKAAASDGKAPVTTALAG